MGRPVRDLAGERFGRLLVVGRDANKPSKAGAYWNCVCDCGKESSVRSGPLVNGQSTSCGCLSKELTRARSIKHQASSMEWRGRRLISFGMGWSEDAPTKTMQLMKTMALAESKCAIAGWSSPIFMKTWVFALTACRSIVSTTIKAIHPTTADGLLISSSVETLGQTI